jgi:hypothetical protein
LRAKIDLIERLDARCEQVDTLQSQITHYYELRAA